MLLVRSMLIRGLRTTAGILLQDGRQGGTIYKAKHVTYPVAFKTVLCITANASNKSEAVNLYDITMTTVELYNNGGNPNFTKWLAFGM